MATKTVTLVAGNAFQSAGAGSGPLTSNPAYNASDNIIFREPSKVQADQAAVALALSSSQTGSGSSGNGKWMGVVFSAWVHVFADSADGAGEYAAFSRSADLHGLVYSTDWSVA